MMAEPNRYGKGIHLAHLNVQSILEVTNDRDMLQKQIESSEINVFTISET